MRYGKALTATLLGLLAFLIGCNSMQTSSAILRYQQGEYEMADSLAREALKINPNDGEAYFYLALSQSKLQNYEDAYKNFRKAAELKPDRAVMAEQNIESNFASAFNEGVDAANQDATELAIEWFTIATEANPENPLGYTNLAKAYWSKAERIQQIDREEYKELADQAIENFEQGLALETDPERREETAVLLANVLGHLYVNALGDEGEQYLTKYRDFTSELPDFYGPHEAFGAVLFDKGLSQLERRLQESTYHDNFVYAGEAYAKATDLRESMDQIEADPPRLAGTAYMYAKMYEEAANYLNKAVQINPNDQQAWYFLEFSHYQAGDYDAAINAGVFLDETIRTTEPDVFQILYSAYRDKALACDKAGDNECFEENRILYEDAFVKYATYKGLPDTTPPRLVTQAERERQEKIEQAIYDQEGIAVLRGRIDDRFVKGTLINKTGEELAYIELNINLLDATGEVVGEALGVLEMVPPEREVSFSAPFFESDVESFEITGHYAE